MMVAMSRFGASVETEVTYKKINKRLCSKPALFKNERRLQLKDFMLSIILFKQDDAVKTLLKIYFPMLDFNFTKNTRIYYA
ncbi:UNVERIFIED_ORG: hypothetical protein QE398_000154 [Atlantibacter sp. SORGH_AS 304]|jgi:hypothetical protein|nr:hypothetical protein [Atlantibacter sp. SORGH_AS_0304]